MQVSRDAVATSWHVVRGAAAVVLHRQDRSWRAKVLRVDEKNDVCLLSSSGIAANWPQLAPAAQAGELVYAVGSPEGLEMIISQGLLGGVRDVGGRRVLVASVASSAGSSGSGVFDGRGRLVGLITGQVSDGQNLTLAVPGAAIAKLLFSGPRGAVP